VLDNALSKKVKLYFCHRYRGRKLKEIGAYFDIDESRVSQSSRRISLKIRTDKKLKKQIMQIENRLRLSRGCFSPRQGRGKTTFYESIKFNLYGSNSPPLGAFDAFLIIPRCLRRGSLLVENVTRGLRL